MTPPSYVTLAIPNFNGARFLERTLESLERNRPFVRWWLQDSCSTDGSVRIAERYATPADRIVVERDGGQTDALNRALAQMGGEVIGFLNSDDLMGDGAAEAVLAAFEEDPALDLVYGNVDWIDEHGRHTGSHSGDISSLAEILDIYRVWWNHKQWVQPEVFWRRRVWDRVGPIDQQYDLGFDYDYWVRCFRAGVKVKKIPRVLAKFRKHSQQKSVRSREAAEEIRHILSKTLAANPPIGAGAVRVLKARLGYDRYQSEPAGRKSLARMLAEHPSWIMLPEIHQRVLASVKSRLPFRQP